MSAEQFQIERRAAQRFDVHVPVSVRLAGSEREGCGFTQNLSARGALLHTDLPMAEADAVEVTLVMPSEITLAENMRVRCRGRVLRVVSSAVSTDLWLRFIWRDMNSCRRAMPDHPALPGSRPCMNILIGRKAARRLRERNAVLRDPDALQSLRGDSGLHSALQSLVFCVEWLWTLPPSAVFRCGCPFGAGEIWCASLKRRSVQKSVTKVTWRGSDLFITCAH